MVVMVSVAPPGGPAEGGEEMVTLADHKDDEKNHTTDTQNGGDEDEFQPLVIDTNTEGSTSMEQDKQRLLRQLSARDLALFRENNPSDSEGEGLPIIPHIGGLSVFPGPYSDSSTPSSRVHSPALSTTSNSGGSTGRPAKQSHPQKARRKTDKILPVDGGKYLCPICHSALSSDSELTKHIRSHNSGNPVASNSCTICGKVLSSQSSLDRHMLVHSGERPFKCKFCSMSFTTNGNMHRHARIHEKDGVRHVTKDMSLSPSPRRHSPSTSIRTDYSQIGFAPSPLLKESPPRSEFKRKLSFDPQEAFLGLGSLPSKSRMLGLIDNNVNSEFTGMSPEGRAVNAVTPSPPQPAPSKPESATEQKKEAKSTEDLQEFQCPECSMSFLCRYGLESHLQTHPNFSFTCQLCPRSFQSRQDLVMHKFQDHKCSVLYNSEKTPVSSEDAVVGFHELDFIDFTCEKFPLIAQAWCDENVHYPSSNFHDFSCKICKKAFPCKAALHIHSNTHAPDDINACKECDIHLADHRSHTNHMLNHIAPKVVAHISKANGGADSPQDVVSKEDFLTCFGLTITKGHPSNNNQKKEKLKTNLRKEDMRINENYYPLLHRMACMQAERRKEAASNDSIAYGRETGKEAQLGIHHPRGSHNADGGNDLADIQQILSHFGSGGGLVNIGQNLSAFHASPNRDRSQKVPQPVKAFNPMVMIPNQRCDTAQTSDNGMRLPVMVTNSFVPIQNRPHLAKSPVAGTTETFHCKYCPEVFSNFKNYKSHTRAHLGLAPYKCSLCPYSSADKSTLIRHLRTHNGERPFQCRVCDFAFTTKANCERHVRKKHMRFSKKDIDNAIGYNQYHSDSAPGVEFFGSPDTVCKYCGEDFKFFRALKHHLRSHSSCTRKPFICRLCESGFSTKANVMRHVQKQHPQVEEQHLEDQIYINESLAAEVAEDTKVYESIEAMNRSPSPTPAAGSNSYGAFGAAKPIVISPIPHVEPTPAPNSYPTSGTFITSPPILRVKPEMQDISDEQPLDFSMKSTQNPETSKVPLLKIENSHMSGGHAIECRSSSDEPMDLSVKPTSSNLSHSISVMPSAIPMREEETPLPAATTRHPAMTLSDLPPDVAARALPQLLACKTTPDYGMLRYKKEYQKYYNPTVGRLQCPYCKMLFKHGLKLQVHIRSHTNERPFSCAYCSASFTIKTNLERHLKTRHPMQPQIIPDVSGAEASSSNGQDAEVIEDPQPEVNPSESTPDTAKNVQATRSPRSSFGGSDDSNCDLSSVNKILDATNSSLLRSFFNANTSDESISEPPATTSSPFAQYQEKAEEDNSNHSGKSMVQEDIDEDGSDDEGEVVMANLNLSPEEIIKQTTEKLPIIKIRNPKSAEKTDDGSGSPAKKKRNSYADSPHKLMCPYCPRAFPWISSLNRHILTHTGQKPFKCPQCPVMFSTKSNRERHLVRKHGLNVLDPATRQMMDRPFKCHICVFSSFSTAGNLNKHYQEKHPDEPMPEHLLGEGDANNNTDTYTAECQENSQAAEASKAKQLEFGMDDDDSKDGIQDGLGHKLMDHVQSSMLVISPVTTPTPTTRTVSPVPNSPGMSDRVHINPERDNYNVDKITECWKCDEDFGSRKGLLRHLKEHNIDLAFKCYLCDASYDQRLECLEHMSQRHPSDWTMLCEKNQVHDMTEFADCMNRIVEQIFIGNSSFGKKLTEVELARYKVQLAEDMKPETDYTQRKVYCSLCPKRFWSLQDLRRHMRSHTGERPFECDLCQKRFTLKHSMMRHRRKHTDSGAASLSASEDEANQGAEAAEKRHHSPYPDQKMKDRTVSKVSASGLGGQPGSDLLHNLLGVEDSAIEEMLDSYSADAAARVLGVQQ